VRHLYVWSIHRRRGVGRALVVHVIEAARGRFRDLRLRTDNPDAARLYEALGFRPAREWAVWTHALTLGPKPPAPPSNT
jgi:GNAT superfamily N-acetyltransferase